MSKLKIMIDENAYDEAAKRLLELHDAASIKNGANAEEATTLHWIISKVLAEHCALLFGPTQE